jgi:mannose-6-phosphate isomerase-like protein (cupin superfamily)
VREPSPITLVGFALAPGVPTRVLIGTLEMPPGERFVPPTSSCQDTLLYVVSGTLDASGTGIASVDAPATIYAGDALRFGPEGDGLVVNTSSEPVRSVVALARSEDGGPARIAVDERSDHVLCPSPAPSDALSRPQRVASFGTSPPLLVMDGTLEVRILLDADAAGAEHAGLAVLSGSPSFAVPEHVHDAAAEILYFEDGSGTMQIGDRAIDVAAGMTVYVPEGTPHSFTSAGTRPMRAIQFYAPSGPEQRFRGMAGGA